MMRDAGSPSREGGTVTPRILRAALFLFLAAYVLVDLFALRGLVEFDWAELYRSTGGYGSEYGRAARTWDTMAGILLWHPPPLALAALACRRWARDRGVPLLPFVLPALAGVWICNLWFLVPRIVDSS